MATSTKVSISTPNPYALRRPVACPYGGNWYHSLRAPSYCNCSANIRSTEAWKESIRNQCENGFHKCADFKEARSSDTTHVRPIVFSHITISIDSPEFTAHTIEPSLQISDDVGLLVRQ
jgi:hypothetical protein